MDKRLALGAALLIAVVGVVWLLLGGGGSFGKGALEPAPQTSASPRATLPVAPVAAESPRMQTPGEGRADVGPREPRNPSNGESAAAPTREVRGPRQIVGRVLDTLGAPLAEVEIQAAEEPGKVLARSLGDGTFQLETAATRLTLEGQRPGYTTVRAAIVSESWLEREALVVLAPAVGLAGRVVDAEGNGIAEAALAVEDDWLGLIGFPLPLDGTEPRRTQTRSGPDGAFELPATPRLSGRALLVKHPDFESAQIEVPEFPQRDLEIRLERTGPDEDPNRIVIFGAVSFPDGSPAQGAQVQLAENKATCDRDGRFELERAVWTGDDALLVAMLAGWQPAVYGPIGPAPQERPARSGPLALTLPGPVLSISGRLVLANGSPAREWKVRLVDPTVINHNQTPPPTAENLGDAFGALPQTDARGRFTIGGLAERDYSLRLWDTQTYLCLEAGPIRAGTSDLELRVPEDALLERLHGRVVTRGGLPVAGARIQVQFVVNRTRTGYVTESVVDTTSDAEGRFELKDLPRRHFGLLVGGDDLVWTHFEPPGGAFDGEPIVIEVERLARVRLDFSGLEPTPDFFQLLDGAGTALSIESRNADGRTSSHQMPLQGGQSAVLGVSESAATLVLRRFGQELSRRPVLLVAGEINELTP